MTIEISEFLQHPATVAFGWTLIHSFWQGLLIWAGLRMALVLIPEKAGNVRYLISAMALALLPLASIATFVFLLHEPVSIATSMAIPELHFGEWIRRFEAFGYVSRHIAWLVVAWVLGTAFFAARLWMGWRQLAKLKQDAVEINGEWTSRMKTLAEAVGLRQQISLAETFCLAAPLVIGYAKPFILVPAGMLSSLSPQQVETILLHELAHIGRSDFLVNVVQSLVEVLYFFNPFTWWVSSAMRREREFCCDDEVISKCSPRMYAGALAKLEETRLTKQGLALSLADNRYTLLQRIQRFTGATRQPTPVNRVSTALSFGILGLVAYHSITTGPVPETRHFPASPHARDNAGVLAEERKNLDGAQDILKDVVPFEKKSLDQNISIALATDKVRPPARKTYKEDDHDSDAENILRKENQLIATPSSYLSSSGERPEFDPPYAGAYQAWYSEVLCVTHEGGSITTVTTWVVENDYEGVNEQWLEIKVNILLIGKVPDEDGDSQPPVKHI